MRIDTDISSVIIDGNTVSKTYTLEDDSTLSANTERLITEVSILNLLDGAKGFPALRDFRLEPPNYTLVMPYYGEWLEIMHPENAIRAIVEVLHLLATLHEHRIVHCDIKKENVLINEYGHITIIDFSHSYLASLDDGNAISLDASQIDGTLLYCAPEILNNETIVTNSIDTWSAGCMFYYMLTGNELLYLTISKNEADKLGEWNGHYNEVPEFMLKNTIAKNLHKVSSMLSTGIKSIRNDKCIYLLTRMLIYDGKCRPTAKQLLVEIGANSTIPRIYFIDNPSLLGGRVTIDFLTNNLLDEMHTSGIDTQQRNVIKIMASVIVNTLFVDKINHVQRLKIASGSEVFRLFREICDRCKLSSMFSIHSKKLINLVHSKCSL